MSYPPADVIAAAARFYDGARAGDVELFEKFLPIGLRANMTNEKGDTLLMLAAYHGHAALVRLLIQHGGDPNSLNDRGQSPLAGAVFKNEAEVVDALLEGGADPEHGAPSAMEAAILFKREDVYKEKFDKAPGRGKAVAVAAAAAAATALKASSS